jgi:hypothetical protein
MVIPSTDPAPTRPPAPPAGWAVATDHVARAPPWHGGIHGPAIGAVTCTRLEAASGFKPGPPPLHSNNFPAQAHPTWASILLCDEPTGNLDSANTASILRLFDELVTGGRTMCLITHDRDVAARAQREVRIVDGELTETTPATVSGGVGG